MMFERHCEDIPIIALIKTVDFEYPYTKKLFGKTWLLRYIEK